LPTANGKARKNAQNSGIAAYAVPVFLKTAGYPAVFLN
jgi:hypothetical protein